MYNKNNLIRGLNVDPKFYLGGSNYLKCNEYLTIPNPLNKNQSYKVKCLDYDYKENVFDKAYEDILEFMNDPTNKKLIELINKLPPKPRQRPNKLNNEEAIEAYKKRPSYQRSLDASIDADKKVLEMVEEINKQQPQPQQEMTSKEKRKMALQEYYKKRREIKEENELKGLGVNIDKYYLFKSDKATKKFYVLTPSDKKIYFGASGYSDYTKHKDPYRKYLYILRHQKNEDWDDLNKAGTWARYILWGEPTLKDSIKEMEKMFNIKIIKK